MPSKDLKIRKFSAVDQVYNRMTVAIRTREWQVGEKIPSEAELAEMYDVNRLTIRLAIQKLNVIGVLDTRQGEGTFVTEFKFSRFIKQANGFAVTSHMLDSVHDFRKLVEVECARLAIENATPEELKHLRELLMILSTAERAMLNEQTDQTMNDMLEADLEFHYYICKMSHNNLYVRSFSGAREAIYEYLKIIVSKRWQSLEKRRKSIEEGNPSLHLVIYKSICNKDFETCRRAYLDMIDRDVEL